MTELQPLLAAELQRLAATLDSLDESSWSAPSLCEAWAVRNVVAHLTMPARYDAERFGQELAKDGFDFQTMSDRLSLRDGDLPTVALLADLRSDTLAAFEQPGGGWAGIDQPRRHSRPRRHAASGAGPRGRGRGDPAGPRRPGVVRGPDPLRRLDRWAHLAGHGPGLGARDRVAARGDRG